MEHEPLRPEETFPWVPAIIIMVIILAGVYFMFVKKESAPPQPVKQATPKEVPQSLKVPERPQIQYPISDIDNKTGQVIPEPEVETDTETNQQPPKPPAPVERKSLTQSLQELLGSFFDELIIPDDLARHFVVTIDNMTSVKLPQRYSFSKPPKGKFLVNQKPDSSIYLNEENYARYTPFVKLLQSVDLNQLVSIYVRNYHVFQEAYADLGYPNRYFNDRLVEVIDHLLKAPEIAGSIELVQPKVYYQFADQNLEALTAGQKIMVRMGPDNARKVKARLQELRHILTSFSRQ